MPVIGTEVIVKSARSGNFPRTTVSIWQDNQCLELGLCQGFTYPQNRAYFTGTGHGKYPGVVEQFESPSCTVTHDTHLDNEGHHMHQLKDADA